MPYPFRRGRTVTITRYTINRRTRERTLADPQPDPIPLCAYDPGSTTENDAGTQTTQAPRFFGPYAIELVDGDEISVAGVDGVFHVDGEVLRHRNDLTAREHCSEIKLTRKRGEV